MSLGELSTDLGISQLPVHLLKQVLEYTIQSHVRPIILRQVCKLWQEVLLDLCKLELSVDPTDADFFQFRYPDGLSTVAHSPRELYVFFTHVRNSSLIDHLQTLACCEKQLRNLSMINSFAIAADRKIDLNLSISLNAFMLEHFPEQRLAQTLDENDTYSPRIATARLLDIHPDSVENFSQLYPGLKFEKVSYADYDPIQPHFVAYLFSLLLVQNGPRKVSLRHYLSWLSELPGDLSCSNVRELSIISDQSVGKIMPVFPNANILYYKTHAADLSWLGSMKCLKSLAVVSEGVSPNDQHFPNQFPITIDCYVLKTDRPISERALMVGSNLEEFTLDFLDSTIFDEFIRILRSRLHYRSLVKLSINFRDQPEISRILACLNELSLSCRQLKKLNFSFQIPPQSITICNDFLKLLSSIPVNVESVKILKFLATNHIWSIPNGPIDQEQQPALINWISEIREIMSSKKFFKAIKIELCRQNSIELQSAIAHQFEAYRQHLGVNGSVQMRDSRTTSRSDLSERTATISWNTNREVKSLLVSF